MPFPCVFPGVGEALISRYVFSPLTPLLPLQTGVTSVSCLPLNAFVLQGGKTMSHVVSRKEVTTLSCYEGFSVICLESLMPAGDPKVVVGLPSKNLVMRITMFEAHGRFRTYSLQEAPTYAPGVSQSPMEYPEGPNMGEKGMLGGT